MKFKKSHYETAFNLSKREKGVGHSLYVTRLWCGLYIETMVWEPEVVPDPQSTPERFCVFLWDPDPESKICEKTDPASLFNFGSSRSLCGHFSSKNMGKLRLDR